MTEEELFDAIRTDISRYFPLGVASDSPSYLESKEIKALYELGLGLIKGDSLSRWEQFVESCASELEGVKSFAAHPEISGRCYRGRLRLHEEQIDTGMYSRELIFKRSFLGPYYSIYCEHSVQLILSEVGGVFFSPILSFSPRHYDKTAFLLVMDRLEREFGATHVPYSLLTQRIEGLSIHDAKDMTGRGAMVYQALFSWDDIDSFRSIGKFPRWPGDSPFLR